MPLQKADRTLKPLYANAIGGPGVTQGGKDSFIVEGEILDSFVDGAKCLEVPGVCRLKIMYLTHTSN